MEQFAQEESAKDSAKQAATTEATEAPEAFQLKKGSSSESSSSGPTKTPPQSPAACTRPRRSKSSESCSRAQQGNVGISLKKAASEEALVAVPSQAADSKSPPKSKHAVQSSAVPKWIYRKGPCLYVDLCGRRMKDSAAATVAKFVRGVLGKVSAAATLDLCLMLSGNRLSQSGLQAFLNLAEETGHHVSCLDLERNRLDADTLEWLGEWLTKQRRGPPQKLLLSHNHRIGSKAIKDLLQRLGRSQRFQSGRELPLWIEARFVGIEDVDTLLDTVSVDINFCLALDREACGEDRCASHSSAETSETPQLHLAGILEQHSNDFELPRAPAAKPEPSADKTVMTSASTASSSSAGAQDNLRRPGSDGIPLKRKKQETSTETVPGQDWQFDSSEAQEDPEVEKVEQERAARRAWANSLGKSVVAEVPSQDLPAPAPRCGLWDLVRSEQRKKQRLARP